MDSDRPSAGGDGRASGRAVEADDGGTGGRTAGGRAVARTDGGRPADTHTDAVESGAVFEALADSIGDALVAVDERGTVVYANDRTAELTGYDHGRLVGGPLTRILPDRLEAAHRAAFDRYLRTGERTLDWDAVPLTVERADGEEVPVEVTFGEFEHDGDRYFTGTIRDVAERREREAALETTERVFDALFEHPSSFAALLDADGRILRANEAALSFVGVTEADVEGMPFDETPWWDDGRVVDPDTDIGALLEAATSGRRRSYRAVHPSPDGDRVVVDGILEPVVDDDGRLTHVLVTGRDVTDQVEANERLHEQQRALRGLHEAIAAPGDDRTGTVQRLLSVGCTYLDLPYGFFTDIDGETQRVAVATGDHPELQPGADAPLSETYCRVTVEADEVVEMPDAANELGNDDPAVERFGLGCYLGARVVADDELHGTLCFAGDEARERSFSGEERTFVEILAEWLGRELERQRYRERLEATRDRLERTFERINDGFFAVDDEWRITYANESGADVLGRAMATNPDADDLVGEHLWEAVPEAVETAFYDSYHEAMESQQQVRFEEWYDPLDAWLEVRAYPSPDGLSVFFQDVTERKRREETLTGLVRTAREMTAADDPETVARLVADAAADLLERPLNAVRLYDEETDSLEVAAVSNRTDHDVADRPAYDVGEYPVGEAFERGEPVAVESGRGVGPVESALYIPIGDRGVLTLAATEPKSFDETTRGTAELLAANAAVAIGRAERERTLERYEAVVENARGMVYVVDPDGSITLATEPFATALGYERADLTGTDVADVFDDTGAEEHRVGAAILESGYADSWSFAAACRTADGGRFPVEVELSRLSGDGRNGHVGVVRDISALEETRTELATQSNRFEYLFENIPDPVNEVEFVDGKPVVRSVNAAFEETFGYDAETIHGENLDDYIVPADARADADVIDRRAREEGVVTSEVTRETADGLRTFLFRGVTYELDSGEYGFGIYTDITDQQERQRRLEVLHTVLRHNLRTEMTIMTGYVDQLRDHVDGDPDALAGLQDRIDAVGGLSSKVQAIERAVEAGDGEDVGVVDVVPLVERALGAAVEEHPDADVSWSLPDAAEAVADDRLTVVVENLVENAVVHSDRASPSVVVTVEDGPEWVTLQVADDGPGIPERERELVAGNRDITQLEHGSGLGLWLVAWLVETYDGDLSFGENDPRGAVVTLRLQAGG